MDFLYPNESEKILGAVFEVYSTLGCGFLEEIYQEALEIELFNSGIPYLAHPELRTRYKGIELKKRYVPDIICNNKIILELKAENELTKQNEAQLHNYLKITGLHLGFLINFGHFPKVEFKRIVLTR